jgi:hypothetical protein
MKNIIKTIFVFVFLFISTQIILQAQVGRYLQNITPVSGLLKDDQSLIQFFKKYPLWNQTTKDNEISIEFLGFEKPNDASNPFRFGKMLDAENNPVLGATFIKNNGIELRKTLYFGKDGILYWSTGNSNTSVQGNYNFNLQKGEVYINMPNAPQQVLLIRKNAGKNLGISGETVEDMRLVDYATNEVYTKQTNSSQEPSTDLSWMFPENRFLIKYTLRHNRVMFEKGKMITKYDQTEVKYAFVRKFNIFERDLPGGISDPKGLLLSNTNYPWKTVVLEVIADANDKPYELGTTSQKLNDSRLGLVRLQLTTSGGEYTLRDMGFFNVDNYRLYINTALNRSGWDNKDGAISTQSGDSNTYGLIDNYFLSPEENLLKDFNENQNAINSDVNCTVEFKFKNEPERAVQQFKNILTQSVYKLDVNSKLMVEQLKRKSYKFELSSKKSLGFGKEQLTKGFWYVTDISKASKKIVFNFENGEKKVFLITGINIKGQISGFRDSDGRLFVVNDGDYK